MFEQCIYRFGFRSTLNSYILAIYSLALALMCQKLFHDCDFVRHFTYMLCLRADITCFYLLLGKTLSTVLTCKDFIFFKPEDLTSLSSEFCLFQLLYSSEAQSCDKGIAVSRAQ